MPSITRPVMYTATVGQFTSGYAGSMGGINLPAVPPRNGYCQIGGFGSVVFLYSSYFIVNFAILGQNYSC